MKYEVYKNKLIIFNSLLLIIQILILVDGEIFIIPLLLTYALSLISILRNTHIYIYYSAVVLNVVFIIFVPIFMLVSFIYKTEEQELGFLVFVFSYLFLGLILLPIFNVLFIKNVKLKSNA